MKRSDLRTGVTYLYNENRDWASHSTSYQDKAVRVICPNTKYNSWGAVDPSGRYVKIEIGAVQADGTWLGRFTDTRLTTHIRAEWDAVMPERLAKIEASHKAAQERQRLAEEKRTKGAKVARAAKHLGISSASYSNYDDRVSVSREQMTMILVILDDHGFLGKLPRRVSLNHPKRAPQAA